MKFINRIRIFRLFAKLNTSFVLQILKYSMKLDDSRFSTYSSINKVTLTCSEDISVGRSEPKKSVIGTLFGSLLYKSLRTPTVDMHSRLGHTLS